MTVIFSWFLLFTFIVTGCHASLDDRESLLESMKERMAFLEKNLHLRSTQAHVGTLEKKLELYIVKNDTLEEQLTSKVKILTTDVSDMQKKNDNCQTEVYKLFKQNFTDFVSYDFF